MDDFDSFNPVQASTNPQANTGGDDFDSFTPTPRQATVSERNSLAIGGLGPSSESGGATLVRDQPDMGNEEENFNLLAASRFTPEQIAEFKANPITFSQAGEYTEWNEVLPAGGLYKGYELFQINNAASKLEKGEELSKSEEEMLYAFVDKNVEMRLRGFTIGGGIRHYGTQMPAFMVEFALTGGVGKLAQKGIMKGAEKLVIAGTEKTVANAIGRGAVKVTAASANVAARTAVMPQRYVPQYAERRLNDEVAITDKGDILLRESTESPAKSALMAFSYTSADVASELSGAAIGKYLTAPLLRTLKTPLVAGVNNVPLPIRTALYDAYTKIKPTARWSDAMTAAGWNGMLNEIGEERVADILKANIGAAGGDLKTMDDYLDAITPSKDQLLIEAGIISIMGGVKTSGDIAVNLMQKNHGMTPEMAQETVNNMSSNELDEFVSKQLPAPSSEFISRTPNKAPPEIEAQLAAARSTLEVQQDTSLQPQYSVAEGEAEMYDTQLAAAQRAQPPAIDHNESFFNRFYRNWVNELDPIQKLPDLARSRGKFVPLEQDTKLLSTAYAGVIGEIDYNLQHNTIVRDGVGGWQETGKGFKPILDDYSNFALPFETDVRQRELDFQDYLVARRYLKDLKPRKDVEVSEEQVAKSIADVKRLADKYGKNLLGFEKFADEVYQYQQRILKNLVDSGVMAQDTYDSIVKKNPNYIPFDRVLDEETFTGGISTNGVFTKANANRIVKTLKGSDKDVKDVFQSIIRNTSQIIDMARRNDVARSIVNLADVMPEHIQKIKTPMTKVATVDGKDIYRPSPFQPKGTITVRVDGKRQFYEVSKPILEAVESISANNLNFIEKLLSTSATVLRSGATLAPEFWARNLIRDQMGALIQSGVRYTPIDLIQGMFSTLGKGDLYNEWKRSGGQFNSFMELDDKGLEKSFKELMRPQGRLMRYLSAPHKLSFILRPAEDISGFFEQSTRVGVFGRALKEGQTPLQATMTSRDATLNFSRRGAKGKEVNRYVPFFNAGVQGVDKLIRTYKENPVEASIYSLATITIPSVTLAGYYLYAAPDDERKEYMEIPQWQKDLFWVFKADGEWYRIPKPFSIGYLFGSLPERIMTWAHDNDKPEGKDFWLDTVKETAGAFMPIQDLPSLLGPLVKTSVESITGYNFFMGRDIYPDWMKRLDPALRAGKYSSEFGKAVGKAFNVSPAKVDNAVTGQFGGMGQHALDAGDAIFDAVKRWNGEEPPAKPTTNADIPLIKAFAVRDPAGYRSNSATTFFKNWEEVQQRKASSKEYEGAEQNEYLKKHGRVISLYGMMQGTYKQMKSLSDEINVIYDDPKMSSERKVARISKLEAQITAIARDANHSYNAAMKGAGE